MMLVQGDHIIIIIIIITLIRLLTITVTISAYQLDLSTLWSKT